MLSWETVHFLKKYMTEKIFQNHSNDLSKQLILFFSIANGLSDKLLQIFLNFYYRITIYHYIKVIQITL